MSVMVEYSMAEGVATLTLNNGKVNAISPQLIEDFNAALDKAEQDKAVIVITGSAGMFSGGYDLGVMKQGIEPMKALVKSGSQLSHRLLAHPFPVIAACSGHAVAKGAFLLLSSDYRIGIDGKFKIGLNEVAIGMQMHHVGIELARARMNAAYFNRSVLCAEMYAPKEAVAAGFLDKVVDESAFKATVQATANAMTHLDMTAHQITKRKARKGLLQTLEQSIETDFASL